MDAASTQEELDEIMDEPSYQVIINSSGWPCQRLITPRSKGTFLNGLVVGEFQKRSHLMRHFANGLSVLGLYDTICSHPNELQSVFVHKGGKLTTEAFLGIIKSPKPDDEKKSQAYDWFVAYIKERGSQGLLK